MRYSGCKFVNVAVPEPEFEPEFELEFTEYDKTAYRWYLGFEGPEAKAGNSKRKAEPKPRRQKKSLGKKSASRGKTKRTRSSK